MSGGVETNQWDIDVPEAAEGLHSSHLRQPPSWSQFMREIDAEWCQYMRVHDAPEHRLATKLDTRFQLDF